ncbi:MAG: hypothetical protein CVV64_07735 [Candidatus Wallbacteria bacterium HGW-Wallbacteria-1]|jgi:hypothetical protein|uniref:Uncharacterized protein n=1 Tax=Candidatus Wallbacteria bacterium HGW-Wallbacteria-1 TaxID=2013854 RepID=A0A2N1PQZ4_9BACT|nr:MAG: hypothetical protein CVV64_07735 [Candidatus Wallbacteria bacterium HGW-Wallbacteria-1]
MGINHLEIANMMKPDYSARLLNRLSGDKKTFDPHFSLSPVFSILLMVFICCSPVISLTYAQHAIGLRLDEGFITTSTDNSQQSLNNSIIERARAIMCSWKTGESRTMQVSFDDKSRRDHITEKVEVMRVTADTVVLKTTTISRIFTAPHGTGSSAPTSGWSVTNTRKVTDESFDFSVGTISSLTVSTLDGVRMSPNSSRRPITHEDLKSLVPQVFIRATARETLTFTAGTLECEVFKLENRKLWFSAYAPVDGKVMEYRDGAWSKLMESNPETVSPGPEK